MTKRKAGPAADNSGLPSVPPRLLTPQATVFIPPRRRRWPKVTGIVLVALALVTAAVFAVTSITGADRRGGATSPEAAVDRFVRSANASDALGVLDVLLPVERDAWRKPLQQMFIDGRRLQLIPSVEDVNSIQGASVELAAAPGRAEFVAPNIAAVRVTGTISSSVTIGGVDPVGTAGHDVDLRVASVREGSRWYVSVWTTIAENLRAHSTRSLSWPPADSTVAVGAPSPIEAVSKLLRAVEQMSVRDLLAILDPVDAAVLRRVGPWFIDGTQQALDHLVNRSGVSLRISDPQYVATSKGNNAVVTFSGLQIVLKTSQLNVAIRDNCGIFSSAGQADTRECVGDASGTRESLVGQLTRLGVSPVLLHAVLVYDDARRALDGLVGQGVSVHNVDGQWFVSPSATVVSLLLGILANGDAAGAQTLVDDVQALIRLLGGTPAVAGSTGPTGGTGALGQSGQPGSVDEFGHYTECLASKTFDIARSCVELGIANGLFPRDIVDGSFLVPDCGWVGSRFDPTLTKRTNDAYVRIANAAAACMKQRIVQGFIKESQMPFELVRVECLRGWNPARMDFNRSKEYLKCQLAG